MLFENVETQFIDENGKARILYFPYITLIISPIPPLDVENIKVKRTEDIPILEASFKTATQFIKEKGLLIVSKDGNPEEGIQGLWVEPKNINTGITNGYIPLVPIGAPDALKKVKYVDIHQNDPIRTDGRESSMLTEYRKNRKIAEILKEYTLYTYSLELDNFGDDSFYIDSKHVYDISALSKQLYKDGNDVMYYKDRLIVDSEETRDKLMAYLKVMLLNDKPGVLALKDSSIISSFYKTISDFRKVPNSLVFTSKKGILRWMESKNTVSLGSNIAQSLISHIEEPYFYRSAKIKQNQLVLIQNVRDGNLERAKSVSIKWKKDRVNIGYDAEISKHAEELSHTTYTNVGEVSKIKKGKDNAPVILYEDGTYGALLFLA
ncbi:MAG TPA: hypothetical protein PKD85_00600 [Saprospiraceae bacterium]|nr:hypothetical protein [Saprospiraceae bacterium]